MSRLRRSRLPLVGFALAGLGLWGLRMADVTGWVPVAAGQALFTLCYGLLLRSFATSLAPGREPLITTIARRVRGALAPDIVRYTRTVTLLWTILFALQLLLSSALLAFAPLAWWSSYVTWISWVPVVALFAVEYAARRIVLRHHPHRLLDVGRVVRMTMAETGK